MLVSHHGEVATFYQEDFPLFGLLWRRIVAKLICLEKISRHRRPAPEVLTYAKSSPNPKT